MSFVGNVLGISGQMSGWSYESSNWTNPTIWLLGWDDWAPYPIDPTVRSTALRHGNFDYLTNSVNWDPNISEPSIPSSLALPQSPPFFPPTSPFPQSHPTSHTN